jgi:hypothetical protein
MHYLHKQKSTPVPTKTPSLIFIPTFVLNVTVFTILVATVELSFPQSSLAPADGSLGRCRGFQVDAALLSLGAILNDFRVMMCVGLVMRSNWVVA